VVIREAVSEEDAALLVELNGHVHAAHLRAEPAIYRETDPAAVEAWFRERLSRPGWHALVAEVDGRAVGLAVTELVERPEHAYAHPQRYVVVNQLAVAPAWRRRGIGRALMEEVHARAKARGVERVELEVRGWNAGAVRFYEGLGAGVGSLRMVRGGSTAGAGRSDGAGDRVEAARAYATACHAAVNQRYDDQPYSFHLGMVADMARTFQELLPSEQREVAVAGAWVHDVIEDARQTYNDVVKAVGVEVAEVAYALTNEKGRTRGERANDRYYEGIKESPVAWFVKVCDRLANVTHAADRGGRMVEVYRKEYAEFRAKLWKPELGPMFARLEELLGIEGHAVG
jgi:ribosomal protein S18 acetylase RimI-like enzyme